MMLDKDLPSCNYITNSSMLHYIFNKLFHSDMDDMNLYCFNSIWYNDKYIGPDSTVDVCKILRRAKEKSTNIEVLSYAFKELFSYDLNDIICTDYCDDRSINPWINRKYEGNDRKEENKMDEIKVTVTINGVEYSENQFKRDRIRMFDSIRGELEYLGSDRCKGVLCKDCPLHKSLSCKNSNYYGIIKDVFLWSQEHPIPVTTNADKLIEVFGEEDGSLIASKMSQGWQSWLDKEYKEKDSEGE